MPPDTPSVSTNAPTAYRSKSARKRRIISRSEVQPQAGVEGALARVLLVQVERIEAVILPGEVEHAQPHLAAALQEAAAARYVDGKQRSRTTTF